MHAIQYGSHVQMSHVTADSRLHERNLVLVVGHAAHGRGARRDGGALYVSDADTKALPGAGADGDAARVRPVIGKDWHEVHVHVRRLARFIELHPRAHRVLVIKYRAWSPGWLHRHQRGRRRTRDWGLRAAARPAITGHDPDQCSGNRD